MGDPFADPNDVAARWRPLTPAEENTAVALLQDASAMLRANYPGLDAQIESGAVDADVVVAVACGMVRTAMIGLATGGGATQQSETVGIFSLSTSYANPTGNLFITAAMDAMIRGYRPRAVAMRYA